MVPCGPERHRVASVVRWRVVLLVLQGTDPTYKTTCERMTFIMLRHSVVVVVVLVVVVVAAAVIVIACGLRGRFVGLVVLAIIGRTKSCWVLG